MDYGALERTGPTGGPSTTGGSRMPGFISVDSKNTFQSAIFLSAAAKTIFGTDTPDVSKTGERKYSADIAVTYVTEPGTQVEFDGSRAGVSTPEKREARTGCPGVACFSWPPRCGPCTASGSRARGRRHDRHLGREAPPGPDYRRRAGPAGPGAAGARAG